MKKLIFALTLTVAAAAQAAPADEKTLLAIGRSEGTALAPLKLGAGEAGQAAKGLRDYLTIKDNFPKEADSAKAHELIAARQEAAAGQAGAAQGSAAEWDAALYAYGQETGMRLYNGGFSKDEAAVLARGFAEALRGAQAPDMAREGAGIRAFMAARGAAAAKEQEAFYQKMSREPGAVKTASGGLFIPRKEGSGPAPKPYYWVKVAAAMRFWTGKPSGSGDDGAKEMQLPEAGFVADALLLMKAGGKATLVSPVPPPEAGMPMSVMELELLSVREGTKPEETAAEPPPPPAEPQAADEPAAEKTVEELTADYNMNGSADAALEIGMAYKEGARGVAQDDKKAFVWLSRAVAKKNAVAAFHLGRAYAGGAGAPSSQAEAAKWYTRSAEWGYPEGMAAIAESYRYGWGVKRSWKDAVNWYTKAAAELSGCWSDLGYLYSFPDDDADKNYAEALKWYTKVFEEAGVAEGATGAGNVYKLGGPGVEQDPAKAVEWFQKGAGLGAGLSMQYLSEAYENGEGVEKNPAEAYKWYLVYMAKEAVQQIHRDTLKKLEAQLTPAEKAAAKKDAQALIAKLVTDKDREDKAYLESLPGK